MPVFAAGAVLAVVIFVGFSGSDDDRSARASGETIDQEALDNTDVLTVPPSTGVQVTVLPDPAIVKTHLNEELKIWSSSLDVLKVQTRLKELAFDPGPLDGNFGFATRQAVWAFEKLVLGTPRAEATGHVTDEMWQIMQDPIVIAPRRTKDQIYGQRPTHVEVYLPQQVLIVFTDDKPILITHISSGSGQTWCEIVTYDTDIKGEPLPEPRTADECGESKTPGGVFAFYLRYEGKRVGPLGGMWNPVYFNYGIAVHGAEEVPLEPASHGCIRIPNFIADYFPSLVQNKDRVYVWDGIREPEQYSKEEKKPPGNYPNPAATTSTSTTVKKTTPTTVVTATTTTIPATTTTGTTPGP